MSYSMNRDDDEPQFRVNDEGELERIVKPKLRVVVKPAEPLPKPTYKGSFVQRLLNVVADELHVPVRIIKGKERARDYVHARAVVVRVLRKRNPLLYSYPAIGGHLSGRDHSTIINLHHNWEMYCKRNPDLPDVYNRVVAILEESK